MDVDLVQLAGNRGDRAASDRTTTVPVTGRVCQERR